MLHLPQALILKVVERLEKERKQRSPTCEGLLDGNLSVIALLVGQTLFHFKCFLSQEKLPKRIAYPNSLTNKRGLLFRVFIVGSLKCSQIWVLEKKLDDS